MALTFVFAGRLQVMTGREVEDGFPAGIDPDLVPLWSYASPAAAAIAAAAEVW
jgi:hypothetical protein